MFFIIYIHIHNLPSGEVIQISTYLKMYEKLSQLPKWQKEDISESTPNKSKENTDKESKATLYEL